MEEIRYCVKNFWGLKDFKSTWYYQALQKCCIPVEDTGNPQLIVSSIFGGENIPSNVKNLLIVGESRVHCPAIEHTGNTVVVGHMKDADIRFNVPFFKDTPGEFHMILHWLKYMKPCIKPTMLCASVISNTYNTDLYRNKFIQELNRKGYHVEGGGGTHNTLGFRVPYGVMSKLSFLADYRFNIAMENSLEENYHTEKLLEGLAAGVPIYYGGENNLDWLFERFNEHSFIYSTSIEDTIKQVERINSNDSLFWEMRNQEPLLDESLFDKEINNLYRGVENLIGSIQ